MDNKKLLIIFVPVIVLVFGYIFYTDYMGKGDSADKKENDGNFIDVTAERDTLKKSKRERYKEKWEKENALTRKIDNDDDFFGKEKKGDSLSRKKAEKIDYTEPLESQLKKEEKPKVVYVYKERADNKSHVEKPVQAEVQNKEQVQQVVSATDQQPVSKRKLGFSTTTKEQAKVAGQDPNAPLSVEPINAVIQDESTVKSGSNVLIRIVDDNVKIGSEIIPKNTLVYGVCSFTNERIEIVVNSIQVGNNTIQQKLKAYDLDGNQGLLVQGGIQQQVKKDVLNDAATQVNSVVRVPILRTIPSSAGNRAVNAITIPLPKGHKLTLRL